MIVLFFLALAFGAPLAQYDFQNSTPYNYELGDQFIRVIASDGLYIFYRNLSLHSFYESPIVITGPGIFENNKVIAPAGDKFILFTIQGQEYKVRTQPAPAYITSLMQHDQYYGYYKGSRSFDFYILSRNLTLLNKTSWDAPKGGEIKIRKVPWGLFFYTYDKDGQVVNISTFDYSLRVLPTGPITFNETHFFVPWHEHLYIFNKNNAWTDDIRMPTSVFGATFYQGKLYIHTYNSTNNKSIQHPFWISAQNVSDFWMVEGVNYTYLYKDYPRGKYPFKGQISFYKPLNIFYVLDNNSLAAYKASGCFFNQRVYLIYCKPVNITGDYFLIKPKVFLENTSLPGDLREGIPLTPQHLTGAYKIKCMVDYGKGDEAEVVRTSIGPVDYLNVTVSAFEVKEGVPINISIRDMKGELTPAEVLVDGEKVAESAEVSLNLTEGTYNITITKACHQPVEFQVRVKSTVPWGEYIRIFLGLILLAIVGLLVYLKFVKKAI